MEWVIQLPVLLFSVIVHEFCHGWAAWAHGDDTAEKAGRLTLSPVAHVDAFGTLFVPVMCFLSGAPMFGWARPVPVDQSRLRGGRRDMARVAFAGPAANFILAFLAVLALRLAAFGPQGEGLAADLRQALMFAALINLFLGFFNLIPVSPLDGSQVLSGLLPEKLSKLYLRHAPYGLFILIALIFSKKLGEFVSWPMEAVLAVWAKMGLL